MDVGGDWIEQFMKKNHVRNYRKIAHLCHILYFDEEENRDIPGTSKSNDGALQDKRRMAVTTQKQGMAANAE